MRRLCDATEEQPPLAATREKPDGKEDPSQPKVNNYNKIVLKKNLFPPLELQSPRIKGLPPMQKL